MSQPTNPLGAVLSQAAAMLSDGMAASGGGGSSSESSSSSSSDNGSPAPSDARKQASAAPEQARVRSRSRSRSRERDSERDELPGEGQKPSQPSRQPSVYHDAVEQQRNGPPKKRGKPARKGRSVSAEAASGSGEASDQTGGAVAVPIGPPRFGPTAVKKTASAAYPRTKSFEQVERERRKRHPREQETRRNKDGKLRKQFRAKAGTRTRREMRHIQQDPGLVVGKKRMLRVIKDALGEEGEYRLQKNARLALQVAAEEFLTDMLRDLEAANDCQRKASFYRAEVFLQGFKMCNTDMGSSYTRDDLEKHARRAGVELPKEFEGMAARPGIRSRVSGTGRQRPTSVPPQ